MQQSSIHMYVLVICIHIVTHTHTLGTYVHIWKVCTVHNSSIHLSYIRTYIHTYCTYIHTYSIYILYIHVYIHPYRGNPRIHWNTIDSYILSFIHVPYICIRTCIQHTYHTHVCTYVPLNNYSSIHTVCTTIHAYILIFLHLIYTLFRHTFLLCMYICMAYCIFGYPLF